MQQCHDKLTNLNLRAAVNMQLNCCYLLLISTFQGGKAGWNFS